MDDHAIDFDSLDFTKGRIPPKPPSPTIYEVVPLNSPAPPGPGILTVKLIEGEDLGVPYQDDKNVHYSIPDVHNQWMPFAILEYDKYQVSVEANSWGIDLVSTRRIPKRSVHWGGFDGAVSFEVAVPSDLTISIFMRRLDPSGEQQIVDLGHVKLDPFLETSPRGVRTERVQGGPGTIFLAVSYAEKHALPLHDNSTWVGVRGKDDPLTGLVRVKKNDTGQWYAMKTIAVAGDIPRSEMESTLRSHVEHSNIAPLQFAFKSINGLSLLSPIARGGHLLYHLQKEYRFSIERARRYAAEMIEALEYLQQNRVLSGFLKPPNIFLSSSGHITLCDPGIFGTTDRDRLYTNTLEWSAPELFKGQKITAAVDWWILGSLLYEMLIGSPPFYHENSDEQRNKIISEQVQLPASLPAAARDIISRLLDKDPTRRLGAQGAAEVKAHAFFQAMDLTKVFKPVDVETVFESEPVKVRPRTPEPVIQRRIGNTLQEKMPGDGYDWLDDGDGLWITLAELRDQSKSDNSAKAIFEADAAWELAWDAESRDFLCIHRLTAERRPAVPFRPAIITDMPASKEERHRALAIALKEGYDRLVVARILEHGVDVNEPVLYYAGLAWVNVGIEAQPYLRETGGDSIPFTPLEWATEHDDIELVKLFLKHGADVNVSAQKVQGPPLIRAVRNRNHKIAEVLLPSTDRIIATRALGLAVEQQDVMTVQTLLENGVRCDFENSDWPLPRDTSFSTFECTLGMNFYINEEPSIRYFEPPLVEAARRGHAELARLLLTHGADPNAAYYGLEYCRSKIKTHFCCGRALHVAIELDHLDVVHALLEGGADPNLPLPIWHARLHQCPMIPRSVL
ncbi:hypothetical protein E8E14_007168 [Neopestalotiopsis sp. 37M]|nr:hypothetical protein E8E14_007168 [Neopestalotiopsis sp. 37M]